MNWHRSVYSWFMFVSFGFGTKLSPFLSSSWGSAVLVVA